MFRGPKSYVQQSGSVSTTWFLAPMQNCSSKSLRQENQHDSLVNEKYSLRSEKKKKKKKKLSGHILCSWSVEASISRPYRGQWSLSLAASARHATSGCHQLFITSASAPGTIRFVDAGAPENEAAELNRHPAQRDYAFRRLVV